MDTLLANPVFQAYVATTIVLAMNLLVLANNTVFSRVAANEAINPEDKAVVKDAKIVDEAGNDVTQRYQRARRNALENVPMFLLRALPSARWTK